MISTKKIQHLMDIGDLSPGDIIGTCDTCKALLLLADGTGLEAAPHACCNAVPAARRAGKIKGELVADAAYSPGTQVLFGTRVGAGSRMDEAGDYWNQSNDCPDCGQELEDRPGNMRYCRHCGTMVGAGEI